MNKLYIFRPGLRIQGKKKILKALFIFTKLSGALLILDVHYFIPFLAYFELAIQSSLYLSLSPNVSLEIYLSMITNVILFF